MTDTCWACGALNPDDEHDINCMATYDMNAWLEEERMGLHKNGPDDE